MIGRRLGIGARSIDCRNSRFLGIHIAFHVIAGFSPRPSQARMRHCGNGDTRAKARDYMRPNRGWPSAPSPTP